MSVYGAVEAYELAFSYRDIPAEVDFLIAEATSVLGREPASMLELAAGPADHAIEFVRRGGRAAALDLSPRMCARAAERAKKGALGLEVMMGDMRSIRSTDRYDLVVLMLDSAAHLLTIDDMVASLRSAAGVLVEKGCYVIELARPDHGNDHPDWRITDGDRWVHAQWGRLGDPYTAETHTSLCTVRIEYGIAGQRSTVSEEVMPYRNWTPADINTALGLDTGLTIAAEYGSFDRLPPEHADAGRLIYTLRRA